MSIHDPFNPSLSIPPREAGILKSKNKWGGKGCLSIGGQQSIIHLRILCVGRLSHASTVTPAVKTPCFFCLDPALSPLPWPTAWKSHHVPQRAASSSCDARTHFLSRPLHAHGASSSASSQWRALPLGHAPSVCFSILSRATKLCAKSNHGDSLCSHRVSVRKRPLTSGSAKTDQRNSYVYSSHGRMHRGKPSSSLASRETGVSIRHGPHMMSRLRPLSLGSPPHTLAHSHTLTHSYTLTHTHTHSYTPTLRSRLGLLSTLPRASLSQTSPALPIQQEQERLLNPPTAPCDTWGLDLTGKISQSGHSLLLAVQIKDGTLVGFSTQSGDGFMQGWAAEQGPDAERRGGAWPLGTVLERGRRRFSLSTHGHDSFFLGLIGLPPVLQQVVEKSTANPRGCRGNIAGSRSPHAPAPGPRKPCPLSTNRLASTPRRRRARPHDANEPQHHRSNPSPGPRKPTQLRLSRGCLGLAVEWGPRSLPMESDGDPDWRWVREWSSSARSQRQPPAIALTQTRKRTKDVAVVGQEGETRRRGCATRTRLSRAFPYTLFFLSKRLSGIRPIRDGAQTTRLPVSAAVTPLLTWLVRARDVTCRVVCRHVTQRRNAVDSRMYICMYVQT